MVQVPLVRLHNRLVLNQTADNRKKGVHNRNCQNQDWDNQSHNGGPFGKTHNRNSAQHKAQRQRTAIAHKNAGRAKIVTQKAQRGRRQHKQQSRRQIVAVRKRSHRQRASRDNTNAAGQTVQAVNQVDSVADTNQPQQGHRDTPVIYVDYIAAKGVAQKLNVAAKTHKNQGGQQLSGQLSGRPNAAHVVHQAGNENNGCRQQQPQRLAG